MNNFVKHLLILTILPLSGCNLDDTIPVDELIPRKDLVLTRSELDFINENNGFALDLFKRVIEKEGDKSIVISPLSVTLDFGMVNNGAVGETSDEINKVIGFREGTMEEFNSFCQSMLTQSSEVDPTTTLKIANAAVINSSFIPLKKDFTKRITNDFSAEVIYKDFFKDDIKGLINKWCEKKTNGMIKDFYRQPIPQYDYAHFLTATYFKGIWSNQFKKSETKKERFFFEDDKEVEVNMMHQKSGFRLSFLSGLGSAIVMPYGNEAFRMNILLPYEGKTIKDIMDNFDSESWKELMDFINHHTGVQEVDVKIPVFETEYESNLKEIINDMGINKAFTNEADFSEMTDEEIFINQIKQKTKIKVDEQGSEAAAVVDVTLVAGASLNPVTTQPQVLKFHADRPFLYAITEVSTGAIFFIGQYTGK